mmetsp:Transcript_28456/g.68516  ORF Transcript_28456/g.68516 Transcript_28456/m.68516 type:complete len:157 (-) Transcript_28456:37-507(-)
MEGRGEVGRHRRRESLRGLRDGGRCPWKSIGTVRIEIGGGYDCQCSERRCCPRFCKESDAGGVDGSANHGEHDINIVHDGSATDVIFEWGDRTRWRVDIATICYATVKYETPGCIDSETYLESKTKMTTSTLTSVPGCTMSFGMLVEVCSTHRSKH